MAFGKGLKGLSGLAMRAAGAVAICASLLLIGGCDLGDDDSLTGLSDETGGQDFARGVGSPALATKNTVRIPGSGPVGNAAGAALAVYPSNDAKTRPKVVGYVADNDWRGAVVAGVLMSRPIQAPTLLGKRDGEHDVSTDALEAMSPSGLRIPGKVQSPKIVAFGDVQVPEGYPVQRIPSLDPAEMAAQADLLLTTVNSTASQDVIITSSDPRAAPYAMPAGPLAAKQGSPVLFVNGATIPRATLRALKLRRKPNIYVVGPPSVVPNALLKRLRRFGEVTRISGATPSQNSVAVARYPEENQLGQFTDEPEPWGWGANDPGHGLVIANSQQTLDVSAATALGASGAYGPLLVNGTGPVLDKTLANYLLDIQPGFIDDPARGVYNRAWLLGDEQALSPALQARVDALCEIQQIDVSAPNGTALD
jgi:hypothetical protein